MGLKVSFKTTQKFGECGCFTFEDNTGNYSTSNRGGYGSPNYTKDDVTKTEIYITTVSGKKYKVDREYLPNRLPINICTSELIEFESGETTVEDNDCGCSKVLPVFQPKVCPEPITPQDCTKSPVIQSKFQDGCMLIEYYVLANSTEKTVCNYTVENILLQSGQKLWVNENGTLVNVTDLLVDGTFQVIETNNVYSEWFVKSDEIIDACGYMVKSACNTITLDEPQEVIISSSIKNVPFLCNLEYKLSNLSYKINIENEECTNCINSGLNKEQANCLIALAFAKFNALKNNPGCNCTCINENIKQINNIINRIVGDCK